MKEFVEPSVASASPIKRVAPFESRIIVSCIVNAPTKWPIFRPARTYEKTTAQNGSAKILFATHVGPPGLHYADLLKLKRKISVYLYHPDAIFPHDRQCKVFDYDLASRRVQI